jgi:NADPH:quinone reductase-like Zn-dependent oxidoreductase
MPLGHEPAGEIVAAGADIVGLAAGDHVGGAAGALAEYLLIEDAVRGVSRRRLVCGCEVELAAID